MLKKIYRICDNRDGNTLVKGITKKKCFLNFISVFGTSDLTVIADNCKRETVEFIKSHTANIHPTSLGNSQSFIYVLDMAIHHYDDSDSVYLVEDDYLHLPDSEKVIEEGIQKADYVSLYDHPDKYMNPSPNPLVKDSGENTRVILTASTHWKFTNSTTMTFAARVKTLKEDYGVMKPFCDVERPLDFQMFCALRKKGRRLITPIPGQSTHCDHFPSPFFLRNNIPAGLGSPVGAGINASASNVRLT